MRPSVEAALPSFMEKFEGHVSWLYLDVKGLVTTGVGCLLEPATVAMDLPFVFRSTGERATREQIAAEWYTIKNHRELAKQGAKAAGMLAELVLPDNEIAVLVRDRARENEMTLLKQFPELGQWPADAQLGLMSMAWAVGAVGVEKFTHFSAAAKVLDFHAAAADCKINEEGNPGVVPRNVANVVLFLNAGAVLARGMDREMLYYPRDLRVN